MTEYTFRPGDLCRLRRDLGVGFVEHDETCDEHPAGTITNCITGEVVAQLSRLAGMYRLASHVPAPVAESSSPGATFGPWADHNPRCTCNVCR